MTYPIRQAYSYQDEAGSYYVALAQDQSEITKEGDTLYNKLQGLILTKKGNGLKKKSSINDETDNDWETSIFFWNHYSEIKDFDNDGLADLDIGVRYYRTRRICRWPYENDDLSQRKKNYGKTPK